MDKVLNLRLYCRNVTLDDHTRDYIVKRIQKMEKFLKQSLKYEVEIAKDKKGKFYTEIMIKTPRRLYRASKVSQSIEGSVDMIVEQMQRQIVQDTVKIRNLYQRGARSIKKRTVLDKKARFKK